MGDRFDEFVDDAGARPWVQPRVCVYLPYRGVELFGSFILQAGNVILVGCAVHLSIQIQPVDVCRSLGVWSRVFLVVVRFIVISGCVAIAQEATDEKFFLCGEVKLLSLLFLEMCQ